MGLQDIAGDLFRSIYNAAAPTRQPDFEGPNPGTAPLTAPSFLPTPPPLIMPAGTISETGGFGGGRDYTMPDGRVMVGGGHTGMFGPVLDAVLGPRDMGPQGGNASATPSTTPPPVTGGTGQPYFDTSGGSWKNDLAKTGVAALLQLIPPMLAGRRHRREVGSAWSQAFAPMMVQGIGNLMGGRADHDAAIRAQVLAGMIQKGDVTFTPPTPGAPPIGNMGGMPVYKTQTLQEKFPKIFSPQTTLPKGTVWDQTPAGEVGAPGIGVTPQTPIESTNTPSEAMQIYGGFPATPSMLGGVAKILADQESLKSQQVTNAMILGGGGLSGGAGGDMESTTTIKTGKGGRLEASRTFKPKNEPFQKQWFNSLSPAEQAQFTQHRLEGAPTAYKDRLNAEIQRRKDNNLPPMTAEETGNFLDQLAARGGNLVATTEAVAPYQAGVMSATKSLNAAMPMVPKQYGMMILDPSDKWEKAIANPSTKAAIDESAPLDFTTSHVGVSLSDFISGERQTLRANKQAWQQIWDAQRTGGSSLAPPTPGVTAPPSVPGAAGQTAAPVTPARALFHYLQ